MNYWVAYLVGPLQEKKQASFKSRIGVSQITPVTSPNTSAAGQSLTFRTTSHVDHALSIPYSCSRNPHLLLVTVRANVVVAATARPPTPSLDVPAGPFVVLNFLKTENSTDIPLWTPHSLREKSSSLTAENINPIKYHESAAG